MEILINTNYKNKEVFANYFILLILKNNDILYVKDLK